MSSSPEKFLREIPVNVPSLIQTKVDKYKNTSVVQHNYIEGVSDHVISRLKSLIHYDTLDIAAIQPRLNALERIESLHIRTIISDRLEVKKGGVDKIISATISAIKNILVGEGFPSDVINELEALIQGDFISERSDIQDVKVLFATEHTLVILFIRIIVHKKIWRVILFNGETHKVSRLYAIVHLIPKLIVDNDYFDKIDEYLANKPWKKMDHMTQSQRDNILSLRKLTRETKERLSPSISGHGG